MTMAEPFLLWRVSFQLSAVSTLALIALLPRLEALGRALRSWWAAIWKVLASTLAAQLATLPLIWAHFGQLSTVALPANLLVLPAQPALLFSGIAGVGVGLISPFLGRLALWPCWLLLRYTLLVVEWLARWPLASIDVPRLPLVSLWALYGALALMVLGPSQRARGMCRQEPKVAWRRYALPMLGVVVLMLAALAVGGLPDGRLHLWTLDVGQGDAILIRSPRGRTVLVDGGPDPTRLLAELGRALPWWQRHLDLVVASHSDADHLTGLLPVAERYRLGGVLVPSTMRDDALVAQWYAILDREGVPLLPARQGLRVELDPGLSLEVLNPPGDGRAQGGDGNAHSLVLRGQWQEISFLLAADIDAKTEERLVAEGLVGPVNVLKVAHHGAATSSSAPFLAATRPQLALISVGADNDYGHPAPEVLMRLADVGAHPLRTDQLGTVELATDGHTLWVDSRAY